jgi:hypothetical protein
MPDTMKNNWGIFGAIISWFNWSLSKEELERAVSVYGLSEEIKWGSARGKATLVLFFAVALIFVLIFLKIDDFNAIYFVPVWLILAFFIFRGHRWAIYLVMLIMTVNSFLGLSSYFAINGTNLGILLVTIFWWTFYMRFFYQAIQIENKRKKIINLNYKPNSGDKKGKSIIIVALIIGLAMVVVQIYKNKSDEEQRKLEFEAKYDQQEYEIQKDKDMEQAKIDHEQDYMNCTGYAASDYVASWDATCLKLGKSKQCTEIPKEIEKEIYDRETVARAECLRLYEIKPF